MRKIWTTVLCAAGALAFATHATAGIILEGTLAPGARRVLFDATQFGATAPGSYILTFELSQPAALELDGSGQVREIDVQASTGKIVDENEIISFPQFFASAVGPSGSVNFEVSQVVKRFMDPRFGITFDIFTFEPVEWEVIL